MSDPTTETSRESCVLGLLQCSTSMNERIDGDWSATKLQAGSLFYEFLIDLMLKRYKRMERIPAIDLAIVGFAVGTDGESLVRGFLPGVSPDWPWQSLDQLARIPVRRRENGPQRWIAPRTIGESSDAVALRLANRWIVRWLEEYPDSGPPIVIHCGDLRDNSEETDRSRRSLQAIVNAAGDPLKLVHVVFREGSQKCLGQPPVDLDLTELWRRSPIFPPARPTEPIRDVNRRALTVNTWPRRSVVELIPSLSTEPALVDPPATMATDVDLPTTEARTDVRWLTLPKSGNSIDQWEDAFCVDDESSTFAIADGASSGIFVKLWASLLVERFVEKRPHLGSVTETAHWIQGCRSEWKSTIDYATLDYFKRTKVDRIGGAATFLSLQLGGKDPSEHQSAESIPWVAHAVGDCCLFLVRDGRLHLSFPIAEPADFGSAPSLLRTIPGGGPCPVHAKGVCQAGDLFLLATDAVAEWLLKKVASGDGPDWGGYWSLESLDWEGWISELRDAHEIVDDDCTLMMIRVLGRSRDDLRSQ